MAHEADRELLTAYLGSQRRHILGILEGMDDEALTRRVLPSGWSCVELVQHLTLDVELFWFQCVVAGDQAAARDLDELNTWQVAEGVTPAQVLERYREQGERSGEVIAATPLDQAPGWWPDYFGDMRMDSLRDVLLHVLVETATHAGHLDAARELVDGRQWMVLP